MNTHQKERQEIIEMLQEGYTPEEIIQAEPKYKQHKRLVNHLFCGMRLKDAPQYKENHTEWHICKPSTAKKLYAELCNEFGETAIYRCSTSKSNAFDAYISKGAPPVLFIDGYTGDLDYEQFLNWLDIDIIPRPDFGLPPNYQFWTTTIVTSALPPEELYMSPEPYYIEEYEKKRKNITAPILRRLETITYHYKENGMEKAFTILAEDYRDFDDLKRRVKRYKGIRFYS